MTLARALLLAGAVLAAGQSYSYDRCDATNGPANWSGQCKTGQQGTPINLCGATSFSRVPNFEVANWDVSRSVTMISTGKTVQINLAQDSTTPTTKPDTALAKLVGRSSEDTQFTYKVAQMHPHWGRTGKTNEGSEHWVNSRAYPFEAHFVHYNTKYSSLTAAVQSGNADALLVVGVFFEVGDSDLSSMTAMANAISGLTKTDKTLASNVRLSEFFDGTGDFYSYGGGLTTPGCNEIVTWIVMTTPKVMTRATLEKFWAASANPPQSIALSKFQLQAGTVIGDHGNFRPMVPLGSRTLYSSMGVTASCPNNVKDVEWGQCQQSVSNTNGAAWIKPAGLVHLLALGVALLISRQ